MFGVITAHAGFLRRGFFVEVVLSRENLVVTRADVVGVNTGIVISGFCHLSLEMGRRNIVASING